MVASEDALHSLISVRKATDIEVIEQSYMYYKVNCRDQPSPLKIQVVQKESEMSRGKKQDLRLFLSLQSKTPSETDSQKQFINVRLRTRCVAREGGVLCCS